MGRTTLERTARFSHKCKNCGKTIEAGDKYLDTFWRNNVGQYCHNRYHTVCPKEELETTETKLIECLRAGGSFYLCTDKGEKILIKGIMYDVDDTPVAITHSYTLTMNELSHLYTETGDQFGGTNEQESS